MGSNIVWKEFELIIVLSWVFVIYPLRSRYNRDVIVNATGARIVARNEAKMPPKNTKRPRPGPSPI